MPSCGCGGSRSSRSSGGATASTASCWPTSSSRTSADPEFFIRKAIGWALREYARVDPDWVRDYVGTHELSPLSRREALKHLTP